MYFFLLNRKTINCVLQVCNPFFQKKKKKYLQYLQQITFRFGFNRLRNLYEKFLYWKIGSEKNDLIGTLLLSSLSLNTTSENHRLETYNGLK